MAFYVFPGANHNRFSHSLGAAYLAKRLIEKLSSDCKENTEIINSAKLLAITTGLLHDIGHGPYSHMFERAKYGTTKFNHEEMTTLIVEKLKDSQQLREYKDLLSQILNIMELKFQNQPSTESKEQIVNSLISSQLDVDRMDYLLRDSHFCGVDYGNYDKKWLIHGIQCCQKNSNYIVGVNRKAIGVIEHYLMARRLMTNCVYKHQKVVASEHLLACLIEEIFIDLEAFDSNDSYKKLPLITYLKKVEEKGSCKLALDEYLQISDVDVEIVIKMIASDSSVKDKSFKMIADRIYHRSFPRVYEVEYSRFDEVQMIIDQFKKDNKKIKSWQISLNDREFKTYKDTTKKIYILDSCENLKSIDHLSIPIFSLTNKVEVNPILIIDSFIENDLNIIELKKELERKHCFVVSIGNGDNT